MGRFTTVDPLGASAKRIDPQSMNRYTFVLNNPLRYVDPDGMDGVAAWDQLSDEYRRALASKLIKVQNSNKITSTELKHAGEVFNKRYGQGSAQEVSDRVNTIMNFVDKIGGLNGSGAWNQIASIGPIGRNTVDITVKDRGEFLDALEAQGCYVTRNGEASQEVFSRRSVTERAHPNDSAREVGETYLNASLHLANDDSSRTNHFFSHFDPTSSIFKHQVFPDEKIQGIPIPGSGWIREKIEGGQGHYNVDRSPAQIRQEIKQLGKSPQ